MSLNVYAEQKHAQCVMLHEGGGTIVTTTIQHKFNEDLLDVYKWYQQYCFHNNCVLKQCIIVDKFPSNDDNERTLKQFIEQRDYHVQ